jgi:hypothetical protein
MTDAENNARKRINFNDAGLLQPDNIGEKGTLMITNGMAIDNQIESKQVNSATLCTITRDRRVKVETQRLLIQYRRAPSRGTVGSNENPRTELSGFG